MNTRFVSSIVLALAGGFVVVASQVFAAGTVGWLAFALGVVAIALAALPVLLGERSLALGLDAATAVLGAWTIVASLAFAGSTLTWLSFAGGLGFVAAAIGGLTVAHVRLYLAARSTEAPEIPAHHVAEHRTPVAA